ncbi:hypothetical protein PHLCEN_2v1009 [Hermanssonia centrifuga]|uniref:Carbohydrate-binding module family 19 domain-containing protein n=1 Tax=Hermanssonia centrifuga TaxID=98765 RepID=A0A2R6S4D9_9APHY|nr:hypothetical protein PHLCEN_2v1009 [Hermanssonia centrifuga]
MKFYILLALSCSAVASARFIPVRRANSSLQSGQDAIAQNAQFASFTADTPCSDSQFPLACVQGSFAQCVNGKYVLTACGATLTCAALPNVGSPGTTVTCVAPADRDARIAATGATAASSGSAASSSSATSAAVAATSSPAAGGNNAGQGGAAGNKGANTTSTDSGDPQTSLTLLSSVIAKGFENNGQDQPTQGQVASLTSSNNFINFCATVPNLPITNGQQIKTGSCNPAPMGIIAATTNIPSAKFVSPKNGATIAANQSFTVQLAIQHLEAGHFVNADENYFAAPQQVNTAGDIQGHSHIVIEKLSALDQTTPTNPTTFAFFKGLNDPAQNGILSADVTDGLDEGVYRLASINTAANHQPALVAVAQHGSIDDMIYFTITKSGAAAAAAGAAKNGTAKA